MDRDKDKKWIQLLRMLFRYRYDAPFTWREFYDDHEGELHSVGIKSCNALKCALKSTIKFGVYTLKIPKDAPRWKPNYYMINPYGIDSLVRWGYIEKRDQRAYQQEARDLRADQESTTTV